MSLPTILFVPGAWMSPEVFEEVRMELSSHGLTSIAVALPSVGTEDINLGVAEDTAAVRAEVERLVGNGKDVILIPHSYAGVPCSNAVRGLGKNDRAANGEKGGVVMILYLTSFAIPAGTSLLDGLGGEHPPWWNVEDGFVTPILTANDFTPKVEAAIVAKVVASLRHEPMRIFTDKSHFEPWKHHFDVGYIFAEKDEAIPLAVQQSLASQFPAGSFTASLASSHFPFVSMPKALSDAVIMAAKHSVSP